jgi:hypothetical protein
MLLSTADVRYPVCCSCAYLGTALCMRIQSILSYFVRMPHSFSIITYFHSPNFPTITPSLPLHIFPLKALNMFHFFHLLCQCSGFPLSYFRLSDLPCRSYSLPTMHFACFTHAVASLFRRWRDLVAANERQTLKHVAVANPITKHSFIYEFTLRQMLLLFVRFFRLMPYCVFSLI